MKNTAAVIKHTIWTCKITGNDWHTLEVTVGRKLYHAEALVAHTSSGADHVSIHDCYRDGGCNQTAQGSKVRQSISKAVEAAVIARAQQERSCNEILALLGL